MTNRLHVLIEQLDRATDRALASAEALGPQAYQAPGPDQWSAAQVVHHLLTTEHFIARQLRAALASDSTKWRVGTFKIKLRSLLLRLALRLPGLKFKIPSKVPPPAAAPAALPELRAEWASVRRELEQVLHEFPGTKLRHTVFRHPRAGWLTVGQTVTSILDHTLHHQQQLNRIAKALKVSA